jgi:putative toxin-antitoxin system antitoxin component (TIGR02293 family)
MLPPSLWHTVPMASIANPVPQSSLLDTFQINLVTVEVMMRFLEASGLELKDIYDVVIPARTLKHRRSGKQNLSRDESDKLARVIRLYDRAVQVFGDPAKARHWLSAPKHRYEEKTPLQMMRTDVGGRMVDEMLGQIEHGMFA